MKRYRIDVHDESNGSRTQDLVWQGIEGHSAIESIGSRNGSVSHEGREEGQDVY